MTPPSFSPLRRSHVEHGVKVMQTAPRGEGKPPGLAPETIRTSVNNVRSVLRAIHQQDGSLGTCWAGCRGVRFDDFEDASVLLAVGVVHSQRPPEYPVAQYRPGLVHQPIIERPFD